MRNYLLVLLMASTLPVFAELKSGPPLDFSVVPDWAQLPKGWNFGECSGVTVDKNDNIWVFNRGAHGIRTDADGNICTQDGSRFSLGANVVGSNPNRSHCASK